MLGAALAGLITVGALAPGTAGADLEERRREAEEKRERVESGIHEAHDELEALEDRHAETAEQLAAVEDEIADIEERLAGLETELAQAEGDLASAEEVVEATQAEIARNEDELAANEADLERQRDLFADRVRASYMHGDVDFTRVLFDASDLNDLTRQTHVVRVLMDRDIDQIEGMRALEASIEGYLDRLAELEQRQERERRAAEREADRVAGIVAEQEELRAAARAEADKQRALLASVEEEQAEYEGLVAELESQSEAIEEELRAIAEAEEEQRRREERRLAEQRRQAQREEERRAAAADSTSRSGGDGGAQASGTGGGQLGRPVSGSLTSGFGYRTHPITSSQRLHAGVDFGAASGTPIYAAESGSVVTAGRLGGYGITVVLSHGGGTSTLYAHQSRLAVRGGQRVSRGQLIGYVGSTGLSTGPHLHFEVRINGSPVNPLPYL